VMIILEIKEVVNIPTSGDVKSIKDFVLYVAPLLAAFIGQQYNSWRMKVKTNRFKLVNHDMFRNIKQSESEVKRWNSKPNREVFKDTLNEKFKSWRLNGVKLAEKIDQKICTNSELEAMFMDFVEETMNEYTNQWVVMQVPQIIISRINEQHQPKVTTLLNEIKTKVHNNDQYPFYKTKAVAVFDVLNILLAETKNDFSVLIYQENYNGELRGKYYKGLSLSDFEFNEQLTNEFRNN